MNSFPRWLMFASALAILTLLCGGVWFHLAQKQYVRQEAERHLQSVVQLKVDRIADWLEERLADASVLIERPHFVETSKRWLQNSQAEALSKELLLEFRALQGYYRYTDVLLVDSNGQVRLSLSGYSGSLRPDAAKTLVAAFRERHLKLDLHAGHNGSEPYVDVIAPLFAESDKASGPLGAVVLRMDANQKLYPIIHSWPTPGTSAETLLVRKDGDSVLFLNNPLHQPDAALKLRIPLSREDVPAVMAALGKEGIAAGKDYRGVEVLSALKAVPNSPWLLIGKRDSAEVFTGLRFRFVLIGSLILCIAALFATAAGMLWQWNQKSNLELEKKKTQQYLDVANIMIIALDTQANVTMVNRKGCEVLGYPERDILGKNWFEHFIPKMVHDEFKTIFSEIVAGRVKMHEYAENCVLTRSGEEKLIAWHNAVITDRHGSIVGTLSSGEDITDRKRMDTLLKESEARYRTLFETAADAIFIFDGHGDAAGKILSANPIAAAMHGYSPDELLTLSVCDLDTAETPLGVEERLRRLFTGGATKEEVTHRRKDGTILPLEVNASLLELDGHKYVLAFARDITERNRAEEALRQQLRLVETLLEAIPGPVYYKDVNQTYMGCNDAFAKFMGLPKQAIIGKSAYDVAPRELADRYKEKDEELFRDRCSQVYETVVRRSDGTTLDVMFHKAPWFGPDGELAGLMGVILDITERKRAEDQIRRNEARLQTLFEISTHKTTSTQELLDFALDQAIKLTESKVGYIYHYDGQKQIFILNTWSKDVMQECHVVEPQTVYELANTGIWGEAVRQQKPIVINDFQAPHPLKKGYPEGHVELYKYMTIPVLRDNEIIAVVGMANKESDYDESDVRELSLLMDSVWRIVQAKGLEEAQRRLSTAIEQAAEGVIITDANGIIQYVNPAFERMTGYTREEAVGKNPRILKSGEHDETFYRQLWETIRKGDVWSGRLVNRTKDGRSYHEEATISPVKDSSDTITDFVAVKRDITRHLELSNQLFQAQKMEAIGTLAGGVAHDFNNLLQIVLGYSELMLSEENLPSQYKEDLSRVNQAAKNGADLVQRLLTFSRKTEIKPLPLNLNRRIEQLRKMLSRTIPKMITIELGLAEDLAAINADPTQVDQILMNLAVNSADAMREGGKIIIETENVVLDPHYAQSHMGATPGRYVLLRVSDTGHGMDKETLKHIFEPFFTTKGLGEGTGLGLAMVYGIVKQHGGHITCESKPSEGATFNIYFPALVSDEESIETRARVPLRRGSETILIVDDEELIRDLGARILTKAGYKVITASDGKEALDVYRVRRHEIALVILDLVMPEMGGRQCLEALMACDPLVKVVIASGYSVDGVTKQAMASHAKGFVNKPFDVHQILEVVRAVLDK